MHSFIYSCFLGIHCADCEKSCTRQIGQTTVLLLLQDSCFKNCKTSNSQTFFRTKSGQVIVLQRIANKIGRLLLKLMQIDTKMDRISNFLPGEAFDIVIKGTEELCGVLHTEDGKRAFKTPSLAVWLAHL